MEQRLNYLKLFYNSTFLPMHYYKNGVCLHAFPVTEISWDLSAVYAYELFQKKEDIAYIISKEFLYYGIVRSKSTAESIVVGPVTSVRPNQHGLTRILSESSVPLQYKDEVWTFFQTSPEFSLEQFLHLLALLHKELNDCIIDPHAVFIGDNYEPSETITQKHSSTMYAAKEAASFHNTYFFEQQMFKYVEEGNVTAIEKLLTHTFSISAGTIGENTLRQHKNIFIAGITLLTRHSIAGGLDIETAYHLSDVYIQESEKSLSIEAITNLNATALLDFTKRVAACKIPGGMSKDIYHCIQYISTHTNQPITVEDVAREIGKSRSYISRKFKEELGFNLSDFIMRKKLEEGKSLLAYTDKSISEISAFLCFSSQSYFQNVFKKKYKVTPHEYRKHALKKSLSET